MSCGRQARPCRNKTPRELMRDSFQGHARTLGCAASRRSSHLISLELAHLRRRDVELLAAAHSAICWSAARVASSAAVGRCLGTACAVWRLSRRQSTTDLAGIGDARRHAARVPAAHSRRGHNCGWRSPSSPKRRLPSALRQGRLRAITERAANGRTVVACGQHGDNVLKLSALGIVERVLPLHIHQRGLRARLQKHVDRVGVPAERGEETVGRREQVRPGRHVGMSIGGCEDARSALNPLGLEGTRRTPRMQ